MSAPAHSPGLAHVALLDVVPNTAEYRGASNIGMVHLFAPAASVLAGKPVGRSAHATLTHVSRRNSDFAQ